METKQALCESALVCHGSEGGDNSSSTSKTWNSYTKDGTLDRHGRPANKGKTGGWKTGMLLLGNEVLATLAFVGVEVNLVLFSKTVLRQTNAEAANTFSMWMGSVYLFSLIGAFLSDSYLGRFLTCLIFQAVLTIGLIASSFTTQHFLLKPGGCGTLEQQCDPHSKSETVIFFISIYLVALGNGASEPALATFGADQFDEQDPEESRSKTSFFSYFYVALNMGSLIGETILVYIQTMGDWVLGYWISTACAILALIFLFCGTMRYRHFKPSGNPISRFLQVIMASFRKMNLEVPQHGLGLYEFQGKDSEIHGARKLPHSNGFKFLDRAAIITPLDTTFASEKTSPTNPWRLCTVTQVEEVKCILRLLPIWLCTILSSVVFIQMMSLFIEQGATMNTTIGAFHFPPASMTAFDIISTSAFIILYDKLIVPVYVKLTKKKPKPPSELQRIGIGLSIAVVAIIIAGLLEQQRRKYAVLSGEDISPLSIFWQTPQYVLVGIAEAFVYVAQWEFFSSQTPDSLKSLGLGLSMSSSAMGSYLCSFILSVVMHFTTKNGRPGWVPPNLNDGHLDRFFFLSAALTTLNLGFYVICARRYKCISMKKREDDKEMQPIEL
ncbi:protein NRT1/ PTR FAMILY 7.3-like [Amaranthus tricolor]|uniref:protein NRT1/ PTR FAMILY 7.3-like n=1 Tax=Amaranthus tricolor TaxID=29722 RepID=UPI002586743B|nr:protein NRT1/ PTR FAMILY 7.3-like [Amaranthus tricolor]